MEELFAVGDRVISRFIQRGTHEGEYRGIPAIRHLELTFEAERPPPSHHVQPKLLMTAEESEEYF